MNYQPLFDYLHELGLIPIQTEMQEIIHIVKTMKKKKQINALRARIERIEKHLAEQHIPNNFSKSNLSEKPNSSEEYDQKPDFIPDWKDAPEDAVCVAMDKGGQWYWYDKIPGQKNTMWGLNGAINPLRKATNASRLHPDYWKSTLMLRPEAGSEPVEPVSEKDYSHLLPEGYEFCEESEAENWVKVEYKNPLPNKEFPVGKIYHNGDYLGTWRPIRKIQYHVAVHEAVTAVPDPYSIERHGDGWVIYQGRDSIHHGANLGQIHDEKLAQYISGLLKGFKDYKPDPYMPDWTKAPEGTVAHAWDKNGAGCWFVIEIYTELFLNKNVPSRLTLPSGLDWEQSLRVKPSK